MTRFVITIAPDNNPAAAQTTVRIDTSSGQIRIAELTVRGGGDGLAPADLPVIDFDLLLRAVSLTPAPAGVGRRVLTATVTHPGGPADDAAEQPRARAKQTRSTGGGTGRSTARRGRSGTAAQRRTAADAVIADAEHAVAAQPPRQYRRMPDAALVVQAYEQLGTIKALAEHFGVPRHTINGWARRLRRQGHQIGRGTVVEPAAVPEMAAGG